MERKNSFSQTMLADAIKTNIKCALKEDLGKTDLTSNLLKDDIKGQVQITTKEKGIFCGKAWVDECFKQIDKNNEDNTLLVGQGHDHPLLQSDGLSANDMHWISGKPPKLNWVYSAKTRYRQIDAPCEIDSYSRGNCSIMFGQKQWAITPGQSVVIYESNVCLGGGYIKKAIS